MRALGSAIQRYIPPEPPTDPRALNAYLQQEFARMAAVLGVLADGQDEVCHVVPAKPRDGMRRYFDGTDANPTGGGEGLYSYYGAAWHKL